MSNLQLIEHLQTLRQTEAPQPSYDCFAAALSIAQETKKETKNEAESTVPRRTNVG